MSHNQLQRRSERMIIFKQGDVLDNSISIAHRVSKDLAMKKGLALQIKTRFGGIPDLKRQHAQVSPSPPRVFFLHTPLLQLLVVFLRHFLYSGTLIHFLHFLHIGAQEHNFEALQIQVVFNKGGNILTFASKL